NGRSRRRRRRSRRRPRRRVHGHSSVIHSTRCLAEERRRQNEKGPAGYRRGLGISHAAAVQRARASAAPRQGVLAIVYFVLERNIGRHITAASRPGKETAFTVGAGSTTTSRRAAGFAGPPRDRPGRRPCAAAVPAAGPRRAGDRAARGAATRGRSSRRARWVTSASG